MSDAIQIDDPADPRLDDFRDLAMADRRPDRPGGRGLVIAEGAVVVRRLVDSPYPVRALLGVERRFDELAADLRGTTAPFYVVEAALMAKSSISTSTAECWPPPTEPSFPPAADNWRRPPGRSPCWRESATRGSRARSSATSGSRHRSGATGRGYADPLYRRSVRVSMGAVLQVPFATLSGWPLAAAQLLHRNGFQIAALTPAPFFPRCRCRGGAAPGEGRRPARVRRAGVNGAALGIADLPDRSRSPGRWTPSTSPRTAPSRSRLLDLLSCSHRRSRRPPRQHCRSHSPGWYSTAHGSRKTGP